MKSALLLVLLAISALAFCREYLSAEQEWQRFLKEYNRQYSSNEEYKQRENIFLNTLKNIKAHNRLYEEGKSTFKMGVNNFTDWTPQELAKLHGFGSSHPGISINNPTNC